MARVENDMVGQLEQPPQTRVQQPRLPARVAGDVQVGPADVADQQRVAAEHEPRLLAAAPPVGDRVGVMGGRVPGVAIAVTSVFPSSTTSPSASATCSNSTPAPAGR